MAEGDVNRPHGHLGHLGELGVHGSDFGLKRTKETSKYQNAKMIEFES